MSTNFQDIDCERGIRIGMAQHNGEDSGFLAISGPLICIDIDVGTKDNCTFETTKDALNHVYKVYDDNEDFSGRLYRTYQGLRVIMTHRLASPQSAWRELDAFEMDPLYKEACLDLDTFIIRVERKPDRDEDRVCKFIAHLKLNGDPIAERLANMHELLTL